MFVLLPVRVHAGGLRAGAHGPDVGGIRPNRRRKAVVRHPAHHHAAGSAGHKRGRAADSDQLAVPLRRALHPRLQQENLHPADPHLPVDFPRERLVPRHPRGCGALHPAGDRRHAGAVAAKDRSALGQLRHHQGQIHASDAHQAARRQNPPAGDLAAVAGRHRGRAAGDDYSRRPAQGLRPAAQA